MQITTTIAASALTALIVTAASAEVDIDSANYTLPHCKALVGGSPAQTIADAYGQGVCIGTVSTVGIMMALRRTDKCANIPGGATNTEIVQVVVQFIEARPNRMHEPFWMLAVDALTDAWPCKK